MAWIESHQELGRHPKIKRLANATGLTKAAAIGYLHLLWWWALDYAQDGVITHYSAEEIADGAQWDGDPDAFLNALIESGFVDEGNGKLVIHDWHEYAGRLIEKRQANRMRSQRARDANKHESVSTEREPNAYDTHTERIPYRATVPNQPNSTVPNRTIPYHTTDMSDVDAFYEFWKLYPKKVGKGEAKKAWGKIKPGKALTETILAAIPRALQSDQWRRENGRFIPNPATWLNQGRWDDEPPTTGGDKSVRTDPHNGDDWRNFKPSASRGFKTANTEHDAD